MQTKHMAASAAALLGLVTGQPAQADALATAQLTNIKYFVIDTDLTDGEAASITWGDIGNGNTTTWVTANGESLNGAWGSLPNFVNLSHLGASADASVVGGGSLDSFVLRSTASSANGSANASSQIWRNFSLSKNAVVVLTAEGSVSAQTTLGSTPSGNESASGGSNISFHSFSDGVSIGTYGYVNAHASGQLPVQRNGGGVMTAAFSNTSGQAMNLRASAYTSVYVETPAAPVPEPQTYAMLLAGLGVLSWLQGRRKS